MPELPEVENVRQTLEHHLLNQAITAVNVRRRDIITGQATPAALLVGQRLTRLARHGKQLALFTPGPCACVHLGMSGSLRILPPAAPSSTSQPAPIDPLAACVSASAGTPAKHVHVVWHLANGTKLLFRDPRRFGGIWTFPAEHDLHAQRWSRLGPDALHIGPAELHRRLQATARPLKAALLDQNLLAGLGNIYVDELLHAARLAPQRPARTLRKDEAARLVRRMRALLQQAIALGGSTLRDYVDGEGQAGGFQARHRVYGRAGRPCLQRGCQGIVHTQLIAGRTTAWCPQCQAGSDSQPL